MSLFPNKFSCFCANKACSKRLEVGEGFVQKTDAGYVSWCRSCVPVRIATSRRYMNESFEIFVPYDPTSIALIKSLPKSKWNPEKKCWTVSKDLCDRSRILEVSRSLNIEIPKSISEETVVDSLDEEVVSFIESSSMYPFQKEGSIFCISKNRCLLGDEMGLGKSVQALMSLPKNSCALIICRAGIKYNWQEEVFKWRKDLTPIVVSGKNGFCWPEENEVVIINHDILPKMFSTPARVVGESKPRYGERLKVFRKELASLNPQASNTYLIVDEAHDFKNYSSQRSKKLKEISRIVKKVVGLTGSPLSNRPPELYGVFDVLGIAGETFGSFENFKRLFNASEEVVNKAGQKTIIWGNPNPIVPELLKRTMLRRLRKNVLPDLPQKTYTNVFVDLDDSDLRKKMDGLFEDWEEMIANQELPPFSSFSEVRRELAANRIPYMLEHVEDAEDQGVPLVVFSSHLAPLDALLNRPGWAVISGDTPADVRQKIVNLFQQNKLKGVGVSIRAGGVGITLTNAWKALFVDLDWTPAANWQAEDRIARIGQKSKKVEIVRLISNHPLDIHVNKLLSQKIKVIQDSIDNTIQFNVDTSPQETEDEFKARMTSLIETQEQHRKKVISNKVEEIRKKELCKTKNELDLSYCSSKSLIIREAFSYMLSVCDGAVKKDCAGFNKPDSIAAHWVLSSGLNELFELETAFLMLFRYKRQLKKNFPLLFEQKELVI